MADNKTNSAKSLLVERSRFDLRSVPKAERVGNTLESKKIKDFVGTEKIFFGRIDHNNNSIVVNTQYTLRFQQKKDLAVLWKNIGLMLET